MKKISTEKTFYFLLLFTTTFFLQSCDLFGDDNDAPQQLPEATQTGANTFGCLINGEPFVVTNTAIYQGGLIQIGGRKSIGDYDEGLSFDLYNPLVENKTYIFDNNSYKAGYTFREGDFKCQYTFDKTILGTITLTNIDKINYIVSGTFQFETKKDGCSDINITNGRFDIRYIP